MGGWATLAQEIYDGLFSSMLKGVHRLFSQSPKGSSLVVLVGTGRDRGTRLEVGTPA